MLLKDKVALITGAASGIGKGIALEYAKEGAKIVITGRNEKRGQAVTACILKDGGQAIFLCSDVRKADECRRAVEETVSSFGRLDILFNNAGIFAPKPFLEVTEGEYDRFLDNILKGSFFTAQAAVKARARRSANIVASVPELQKRTRSRLAMRSHRRVASSTSIELAAAKAVPRAACLVMASTTFG